MMTCPTCGGPGKGVGGLSRACCGWLWAGYPPDRSLLPSPPPTEEPAHLTGKVLGFRQWTLDEHGLKSAAGKWRFDVNEAECRRELYGEMTGARYHQAPAHDCTCGLYAWYGQSMWAPSILGSSDEHVYGAVLAWGQIEAQPQGFRAQYAQPVMLAYSEQQPFGHVNRIMAIAGEMGVPCVLLDDLEREAGRFGKPIPEELRPAGMPSPWKMPMLSMSGRPTQIHWGGNQLPQPYSPSIQFGTGIVPGWGYSSWKIDEPVKKKRSAPVCHALLANAVAAIANLVLFVVRGTPFSLAIGLVALSVMFTIWISTR